MGASPGQDVRVTPPYALDHLRPAGRMIYKGQSECCGPAAPEVTVIQEPQKVGFELSGVLIYVPQCLAFVGGAEQLEDIRLIPIPPGHGYRFVGGGQVIQDVFILYPVRRGTGKPLGPPLAGGQLREPGHVKDQAPGLETLLQYLYVKEARRGPFTRAQRGGHSCRLTDVLQIALHANGHGHIRCQGYGPRGDQHAVHAGGYQASVGYLASQWYSP